jgi:hypothetical protein
VLVHRKKKLIALTSIINVIDASIIPFTLSIFFLGRWDRPPSWSRIPLVAVPLPLAALFDD